MRGRFRRTCGCGVQTQLTSRNSNSAEHPMHALIRIAAIVTSAAVAAAAASVVAASSRWERESARLVSRLEASARHDLDNAEGPTRTDAAFDSLPQPVARYFAFALPGSQPRIRHAH